MSLANTFLLKKIGVKTSFSFIWWNNDAYSFVMPLLNKGLNTRDILKFPGAVKAAKTTKTAQLKKKETSKQEREKQRRFCLYAVDRRGESVNTEGTAASFSWYNYQCLPPFNAINRCFDLGAFTSVCCQ